MVMDWVLLQGILKIVCIFDYYYIYKYNYMYYNVYVL